MTFDYELFFGKPSGSYQKCILEPTEKILDILERYEKRAIFFVDVLYLQKLEEYGLIKPLKEIEKQLMKLISLGHSIELHLHPHWLDAIYHDSSWEFTSYEHYRLHTLSKEKILNLFIDGRDRIEKIAHSVNPSYKVSVFRAGGWSIEPFSKLKEAFLKTGIMIDSSVGYGMKLKGVAHHFDFSDIPKKAYYKFEETTLKEEREGTFMQVPITTYKTTILHKIARRIRRKMDPNLYKMMGDGRSVGGINRNYLNEIITYEMFSLESLEPKRLLKQIDRHQESIVTLISHPKGMSPIALESLDALCQSGHEFISYKEIPCIY